MPPRRTETKYYTVTWKETDKREEASKAVHLIYDDRGNVIERRYESVSGRPTLSTDPRAAGIMREEREKRAKGGAKGADHGGHG